MGGDGWTVGEVGDIDRGALERLGAEYGVIDAGGPPSTDTGTGDTMTDADAEERGREAQMRVERHEPPGRSARLLVIGGAEDPDEDDMTILPHLVEMAGGKDARIIICSSPSA